MKFARRHLWGTIFILPAILMLAGIACASDWTAPAAELAKQAARMAGSASVTLAIVGDSSLSSSDVAAIRRELETQLRGAGVGIRVGEATGAELRITLSENLRGYLWVAELKQGDQSQVAMVPVPRLQVIAPHNGPSVIINKQFLWSQPMQILDAWVDNNRMVLLDAEAVSTFTLNSGVWQREQQLEITRGHAFPRDLRGLLVPAKDHIADAYLPGTVCNVASSAIACHEGDDPWPVGARTALFNSGRNYFTGTIFPAPGKAAVPFYSMATLDRGGPSLLLVTGTDGRIHLNDGVTDRALSLSSTSDWGSDIAAIRSQCGGGTQVLVTAAGDDNATDTLRAFEFPAHEPVPVSAPIDFPGPITALWTHGNNHGDAVTAVVHNLQTGSYEAYSVTLTCNR